MCGFCGFTGSFPNSDEVITAMSERIAHRGPDAFATHVDENISLGHRRLSFIDLSETGTQPFYNEDGTLILVFNGEIYNYKPIREELIARGHIFKSTTDSEVLIHLYEESGAEAINRLRGMFAFVIFDSKTNTVFGARDHFGVKPFYYSIVNEQIMFASEIKSFLEHPHFNKEVNLQALENYLTFQYSVLDETFFKGTFKLPPAHYFIFKDGEIKLTRYFTPKFEPTNMTLPQTIKSIDSVVKDSIERHIESEVEIGSFLSSGVDSSYLAASCKGIKTFTVGFDYDNYNEIGYAKALAEKIDTTHFTKQITTEEYWGALEKVQYHMDEPLADASAVALYFVSQLAKGQVKAVMSGEGADEFFGGYNIYKEPLDLKILTVLPMPVRKFLGKMASLIPFKIKGKNFLIRGSKVIEERFIGNAYIFSVKERNEILKNKTGKFAPKDLTKPVYEMAKDSDDITKMQMIDMHFWMVGDILLKGDKMSMANSLEVRVPFLDKEVFRVASKIPTALRVNKTDTKYAFRMAAKAYLPEVVANKKKLGFPVPIRIWLKEDKYYNRVKEAFLSETANKFFDTTLIVNLLENHKKGKDDNSRKIWVIFMFLIWHKQFFPEEYVS